MFFLSLKKMVPNGWRTVYIQNFFFFLLLLMTDDELTMLNS